MESLILKLIFIVSIVFDSLSDAWRDKYNRRNHEFENISTLALLCVALYVNFYYIATWYEFASYILLRIGIFNVVYNNFRGLSRNYVGDTDKWFDKPIQILNKFEEKYYVLSLIYFLSLFFGLCIGLN